MENAPFACIFCIIYNVFIFSGGIIMRKLGINAQALLGNDIFKNMELIKKVVKDKMDNVFGSANRA